MTWQRLTECPACGKDRCKQKGRRVFCFRSNQVYFINKEGNISGKGIKKFPKKSNQNQKELGFMVKGTNYDFEDL